MQATDKNETQDNVKTIVHIPMSEFGYDEYYPCTDQDTVEDENPYADCIHHAEFKGTYTDSYCFVYKGE